MDRDALQKKVGDGLCEIAGSIAEDCEYILRGPHEFVWPEGRTEWEDEDCFPDGSKIWVGQVYGSSYGPDMERIICEDIGLDEEETLTVLQEAWNLCFELDDMLNRDLERGMVFMDDNCLWFRYVEEE